MKKFTLYTIATVFGALMCAAPAFAATTATLTPSSANVKTGTEFSVALSVDSAGTSNFADRVEVTYPADMLEVVSFSQKAPWMPLTQSGYDSTDNIKGVMIKTAGYTGGISAATDFGTVIFRAKKAGSATVAVGTGSLAYEASVQTLVSGNSIAIAITGLVLDSSPAPVTAEVNKIDQTQDRSTTPSPLSEQSASAIGAGIFGGMTAWFWIVGVIALLIIARFGYKAYAKKEGTKE